MRRVLLLCALFVIGFITRSHGASDSGWVRVSTVPSGLTVTIDGRSVGVAPLGPMAVPAGRHRIGAVHGTPFTWDPPTAFDSVEVVPGGVSDVEMRVPISVVVRSAGASITTTGPDGERRTTPFRWPKDRLHELRIVGPNGMTEPLALTSDTTSVMMLSVPGVESLPNVMTGAGASGIRSEAWTWASGATMLVSGVLAAVFREHANAAAEEYIRTGDPAVLAKVRRNDRLAGVSMVAVNLSLGAFFLFLGGS